MTDPFAAPDPIATPTPGAGPAQPPPATALTGLWVVPGVVLLVLPVVWFVTTNGALNAYWRSCGAS